MKELLSCDVEEVILGDLNRIFVKFVGEWLFLVVSILGILLLEMISCEGNVLEDRGCCYGNIEDVSCEKIYILEVSRFNWG